MNHDTKISDSDDSNDSSMSLTRGEVRISNGDGLERESSQSGESVGTTSTPKDDAPGTLPRELSAEVQGLVYRVLGVDARPDPDRTAYVTVLPGRYGRPSAVAVTIEGTPIRGRLLIDFDARGVWFYVSEHYHRLHTAWGKPRLVGGVIELLKPHVPEIARYWRGK